jgi:hypothetical protein
MDVIIVILIAINLPFFYYFNIYYIEKGVVVKKTVMNLSIRSFHNV